MDIKGIAAKIGGFVTGFLPTIMKFGEAFEMILRLVKVGVAKDDLSKLETACDSLDSLGVNLADLAGEVHELSIKLRAAIDSSGPGGSDITGIEIRELIDEITDDAPELDEIRRDLIALTKAVKEAM